MFSLETLNWLKRGHCRSAGLDGDDYTFSRRLLVKRLVVAEMLSWQQHGSL